MLWGKLKGAQCSETVKSRVPSIWFVWKNLRFSSRPRAKVRCQGPPGSARAQPWCLRSIFGCFWGIMASFSSAVVHYIYNVIPQGCYGYLQWRSRLSTEGLTSICAMGMIKWGQKLKKPKKLLRASNKTRKNPMGNFWALKISESKTSLVVHVLYLQNYAAGIRGTTTNLQIVLNNPKKP